MLWVGVAWQPLMTGSAVAGSSQPVAGRVVLPASVTPDRYRIDITPDAAALTFKGTVEIDVTVHAAIREIVLNSADITVDHAALSAGATVDAIRYDETPQTATFSLSHELKPGAYTLRLAYHGKIYQQASGLFALDYATSQGKARAVFTQFENSDARRFVPCWDEPGRKATFQLTATVPESEMAISNMPISSTDVLADHLKRVHFSTSPKMSTYLLFFGMGDFERVHRVVDGVDVGVVVKRGDTADASYALEAASTILSYYNTYFGTPYPLPKLDLVAAPGASQFFGAMENWGAILYFERVLLIDPRISTELDRQDVYVVVAHEMAHQWFGDLVTMSWWDDLWLNEGFASWMENKVTDHFHPDWKIWLQALRQNQNAMAEDARQGTHPIITPINDVLQASGAFDTITYSKGAAVIRMLESYVGEDAFRAGVRRYIHDHAYGNTVTDDLWKEVDVNARRPIMEIAHDFTLQAGVPLINEVSSLCLNGSATVHLAQSHFAIDPDSTAARLWHVPVTIAPITGPSVTTVVSRPKQIGVKVSGCPVTILNAGQTGYFRSRYSRDGAAAIATHYAALSAEDQLGALNDAGALAEAGEVPMAALLELVKNFPPDADPVAASTLVAMLQKLNKLYDGLPTQAKFQSYARTVLAPFFARVGWDKRPGEEDNVAVFRSNLLAALSDFGDPPVIAEARQRFSRLLTDTAGVDPGVRRTVLGIVARHADQASWDRLHGMAKSAATEIERREFYDLLAAPDNVVLVQQALTLAISGEPPPTVAPDMVRSATSCHPELAFEFAIAHWDIIAALIEPTSRARFVPSLVSNASDRKLIDKLDAFAEQHIPPDARQDLRKAESNIRYLATVRDARLPEIDRGIQSY